MKKCLKIVLIIILAITIIWYLFGENGPLNNSEFELWFMGEVQRATELVNGSQTSEADEDAVAEPVEEPQEVDAPVINTTTTLVFTGDVEISEYVQANYNATGVDGVVSEEIKNLLNNATFTMINNEFCFSTRGTQAADKQYTFRVDPSYVNLLADLGVDVAGLANNHVLDYGRDALTDTFTTLDAAGIEYTGAGNSVEDSCKLIIKTDDLGRNYGFLAASRVIPFGSWNIENAQPGVFTCYDDSALIEQVKLAREQVDYLYVMVHWGVERTTDLEDHQKQIGHDLIDAGADGVIGMHSHCVQPIEFYNDKPIFYSLGNFIFNQTINSGAAVEITIDGDGNQSARIIPIQAVGACTSAAVNSDNINFIAQISDNIAIDEEGFVRPR